MSWVNRYIPNHDWGALEQGTEPPTAPRAPQHKWLPTAPGVCSLLCVCTLGGLPYLAICHVTFKIVAAV